MRTPTLEWGKAPGKTTGLIGRKWKHRKVLELTGTNRPRTYHKECYASTVRFWNNNQPTPCRTATGTGCTVLIIP